MATDQPAPAVWGGHSQLGALGASKYPAVRDQQRKRHQPHQPQQAEPAAGEGVATSPATPTPDLVAGIQQRQAEHERLLDLCRTLRAARPHRCPGRCVFTGELRRGGLSVFRSALDSQE